MKKNTRRSCVSAFLICIVATLQSCASGRVAMATPETVRFEVPDSTSYQILGLSIAQDGDEVVIRGRIRRLRQYRQPITGHIDIELVDPEGNSVNLTGVPYYPRNVPLRGSRQSRFIAHTEMILPDKIVVRLRRHTGTDNHT